jgi:hypothetical protein
MENYMSYGEREKKMAQNKITIVKSPVVPMNLPDEFMVTYGNQITYSVRLSNGMIVSRPEDFPNKEKPIKRKYENYREGEE